MLVQAFSIEIKVSRDDAIYLKEILEQYIDIITSSEKPTDELARRVAFAEDLLGEIGRWTI